MLKLIVLNLAQEFEAGSVSRIVANDPHGDIERIARAEQIPFALFDPTTGSGIRWAMGTDVGRAVKERDDLSLPLCIAQALIPRPSTASRFDLFYEWAHGILAITMAALSYRSGANWTFRDVVLTLGGGGDLDRILSHPSCKHLASQFLALRGIGEFQLRLEQHLAKFIPWIAGWEQCRQELSIDEWFRQRSILLFPGAADTAPVFSAFLAAVAHKLMNGVRPPGHTFFVIDDFDSSLISYEEIGKIILNGTRYNASTAVTAQSPQTLTKAAGGWIAPAILAAPLKKLLLRQSETSSAELCTGLTRGAVSPKQVSQLTEFQEDGDVEGFEESDIGYVQFIIRCKDFDQAFKMVEPHRNAALRTNPKALLPWSVQDRQRLGLG